MDNNKQFLGRMLKHSRQREKAPRAWPNWSQGCMYAKSLQSCLTLCNAMDCSLPGSFVPGTLQARILEWVAMPSSRGSSWPKDRTCNSCGSCIAGESFTTEPLGSPNENIKSSSKVKCTRRWWHSGCPFELKNGAWRDGLAAVFVYKEGKAHQLGAVLTVTLLSSCYLVK